MEIPWLESKMVSITSFRLKENNSQGLICSPFYCTTLVLHLAKFLNQDIYYQVISLGQLIFLPMQECSKENGHFLPTLWKLQTLF